MLIMISFIHWFKEERFYFMPKTRMRLDSTFKIIYTTLSTMLMKNNVQVHNNFN